MINNVFSIINRLFFSFLFLIVSTSLYAAPNGQDLLIACEHSLVKGFSGTKGMMCTWYVTPCDCFHSNDSKIPRVCLPPTADIDDLALEVVEGLTTIPELLDKHADVAVGVILEKTYPCAE